MARQIPEDIRDYPFDVIGAGINGAGIARDAAMRGLKVLLLDKGDIPNATTQWSTRLIHGGLRYLEHYEVHLVRGSLAEREKLLRIAPHLVRPLKFVVPIYERSRRGPGLICLGMIGYDALSFDKSVPNHKMLSPIPRYGCRSRRRRPSRAALSGARCSTPSATRWPRHSPMRCCGARWSASDRGSASMWTPRRPKSPSSRLAPGAGERGGEEVQGMRAAIPAERLSQEENGQGLGGC